jgi:hypothetical protein
VPAVNMRTSGYACIPFDRSSLKNTCWHDGSTAQWLIKNDGGCSELGRLHVCIYLCTHGISNDSRWETKWSLAEEQGAPERLGAASPLWRYTDAHGWLFGSPDFRVHLKLFASLDIVLVSECLMFLSHRYASRCANTGVLFST